MAQHRRLLESGVPQGAIFALRLQMGLARLSQSCVAASPRFPLCPLPSVCAAASAEGAPGLLPPRSYTRNSHFPRKSLVLLVLFWRLLKNIVRRTAGCCTSLASPTSAGITVPPSLEATNDSSTDF